MSPLEELFQIAMIAEAARREEACERSLVDPHQRGVRIEVHDWETRYFLDPEVPWGTIHEHAVAVSKDV
jgi:hypothetical protein